MNIFLPLFLACIFLYIKHSSTYYLSIGCKQERALCAILSPPSRICLSFSHYCLLLVESRFYHLDLILVSLPIRCCLKIRRPSFFSFFGVYHFVRGHWLLQEWKFKAYHPHALIMIALMGIKDLVPCYSMIFGCHAFTDIGEGEPRLALVL